jgi:hypothetical protein
MKSNTRTHRARRPRVVLPVPAAEPLPEVYADRGTNAPMPAMSKGFRVGGIVGVSSREREKWILGIETYTNRYGRVWYTCSVKLSQ